MKKSISYWCFPGGLEGAKPLPEAMAEAKAAGFEAIELAVGPAGELSLKTTRAQCAKIRAAADRTGIEISGVASGLYWAYNLGSPQAAQRRKAESALKKMLEITSWLGTDALLTIPAAVDVFFDPSAPVVPADVALERSKAGLENVLPTAEKCRVALAIENVWNKFLYSPTEMRDFIDGFASPWVGAYFDVGNVMPYGYPDQWIRILGERIKRVHLKDFKVAVGTADGFCDLLEGDVPWPDVIQALKAIGYTGYLTAEMIPLYRHYPEVRIRNTSNAMDAILGRK